MGKHWLARPATIRRLWIVFAAVLGATVLVGLALPRAGHFEIERVFAFNALFGFLACAALIVLAKGLGLLLKRPDTYYEADTDD